jgi:hypothetical protein
MSIRLLTDRRFPDVSYDKSWVRRFLRSRDPSDVIQNWLTIPTGWTSPPFSLGTAELGIGKSGEEAPTSSPRPPALTCDLLSVGLR